MASCESHQVSTRYFSILVLFRVPSCNKAVLLTSQQLRRTAWMPLLKRAGVRYRNPYQIRHTYASMMISQGENIMWLSKQMGHADAEVTLKKYARWIADPTVKGRYQLQNDWGEYIGLEVGEFVQIDQQYGS